MLATKHRTHTWLLKIIVLEVVILAVVVGWALVQSKGGPLPKTATDTPAQLKAVDVVATRVAGGLAVPVAIANTGDPSDDRLFVVEQAGTIRTVTTKGEVGKTPFLDITSNVDFGGEKGLLGLAFHPKYASNGYFYVNYVNKQNTSVIARFTLNKQTGRADAASEKVILTVKQPYPNHKGGVLAFGPDGYLYAGFGDGGSGGDPQGNGQSMQVLLGKILRLDVDHGDPYSVPSSNPFVKDKFAKPEIWAVGLRNPWRMSFDRQTGNLYIADVGQDEYEEINLQSANSKGGENYGWRCAEGYHQYDTKKDCQSAETYTQPLLEYDHSNNRCSVIGGYVYRGSQEPALAGKYFYADYCSGEVLYAHQQNGRWAQTLATTVQKPTTFGEDSQGELYLATQESGELFVIEDRAN